jgi:hypothetical protein
MAAYLINVYDESRRASDSSSEQDASTASAVPQNVLSHFQIARTPQPSVESLSYHPKRVPDIVERPPTPVTATAVPEEYRQRESEEGDYIVGCQCEFCEEFASNMANQLPPTPQGSPGHEQDEHNAVMSSERDYFIYEHDGSDTEVYDPDEQEMANSYVEVNQHMEVVENETAPSGTMHTSAYVESNHVDANEDDAMHNSANGPIGPLAEAGVVCEFTAAVCNENHGRDPYFRKCVSHVFGRNKACTRTIPEYVWLYFCRKHYQRARYRIDNWVLKQCDMIHKTLIKLEIWGGVVSFKVTVRKREARRIRSSAADTDDNNNSGSADIVAKAPGTGRKYTSKSGTEKRAPVNVASPVPQWLEQQLSDNMSFHEVHNLIAQIERYARQMELHFEVLVTFPDIEILPQFTDEILAEVAEARRQASRARKTDTSRTRKGRISKKKGRVTKLASGGPHA